MSWLQKKIIAFPLLPPLNLSVALSLFLCSYREKPSKSVPRTDGTLSAVLLLCVCMCDCVCVRERENEFLLEMLRKKLQ